jgi:hypothetical protein
MEEVIITMIISIVINHQLGISILNTKLMMQTLDMIDFYKTSSKILIQILWIINFALMNMITIMTIILR